MNAARGRNEWETGMLTKCTADHIVGTPLRQKKDEITQPASFSDLLNEDMFIYSIRIASCLSHSAPRSISLPQTAIPVPSIVRSTTASHPKLVAAT